MNSTLDPGGQNTFPGGHLGLCPWQAAPLGFVLDAAGGDVDGHHTGPLGVGHET